MRRPGACRATSKSTLRAFQNGLSCLRRSIARDVPSPAPGEHRTNYRAIAMRRCGMLAWLA